MPNLSTSTLSAISARRGEHEWNVGLGLTDHLKYDTYGMLVEYEWAPVDHLGLEVELPFSLSRPTAAETSGRLFAAKRPATA